MLGENGRIFLQDMEFTVRQDGDIYARPISDSEADAVFVDRLKIVEFENERFFDKKGKFLLFE